MSTREKIFGAAGRVMDPEIGRSLADLRMLKGVTMPSDAEATVDVELPTPAYPRRERLAEALQSAIKSAEPGIRNVSVRFTWQVQGKESGGTIGLHIKNVIAVGSGKGGVGKSTIAASLAYGLQSYGAKVGLMDADVYGPSIPHLVGAKGEPAMVQKTGADGQPVSRIVPVESDGLKLMSIGFLIKEDQAVIWRGPMLHKLLTQFLRDTEWGDLDYLIIDLPPGTGDVSLTLSQLLGLAGAVVVCSPQQVALLDAVRAINMFRQVKIPVLGVVENMSGEMFGRGGAAKKAQELGIPFLGEVPCEAEIRIRGDAGRMSSVLAADSPAREPLLRVCERTAMEVAKSLLQSPKMPELEIL